MDILWVVDDGYVSDGRNQSTFVDDDEFAECETVDEVVTLVSGAIKEDFEQRICPSWDSKAIAAKWKELKNIS